MADRPIVGKVFRYAQRVVEEYDSQGNGDGRLDPAEWGQMRGDPQGADFDGDGAITVTEFAQYVANHGWRRKIYLVAPPWMESEAMPPLLHPATSPNSAEGANPDPSLAGPDGQPDSLGPPELRRQRRFFTRLPKGLPGWFDQRDADGDGQLTLAEYAPRGLKTQLDQFAHYDANRDGVLTAEEYLRAVKAATPSSGE